MFIKMQMWYVSYFIILIMKYKLKSTKENFIKYVITNQWTDFSGRPLKSLNFFPHF